MSHTCCMLIWYALIMWLFLFYLKYEICTNSIKGRVFCLYCENLMYVLHLELPARPVFFSFWIIWQYFKIVLIWKFVSFWRFLGLSFFTGNRVVMDIGCLFRRLYMIQSWSTRVNYSCQGVVFDKLWSEVLIW